jgi:DNA polymerase I
MNHKLIIIDGMAALFRAHFSMARAPLTLPNGTPAGALYGFLKVMFKILKEQNPSHFCVTWDLKEKTFRHNLYPAYKGNRSETPPELLQQIPLIQEWLVKMGVPSFSKAGFESDDLIGTLVKKYTEQWATELNSPQAYIASIDKDFLQLVNDNIFLLSLKNGDEFTVCGADYVQDYFGVPPSQVIDVLAIMGDSSDNIPGISGLGPKGAAKLIQEFGSLENCLNNVNKIKNDRTRKLVLEQQQMALLSYELVTIHTEVELNVTLNDLNFTWEKMCQSVGAKQIFVENKMNSLLRLLDKISSEEKKEPNSILQPIILTQKNTEPEKFPEQEKEKWGARNYSLISSQSEWEKICERIVSNSTNVFCFDTETTGLDLIESKPIGFSFCFEPHVAHYVSILESDLQLSGLQKETIISDLQKAFLDRTATVVGHNLKFDLHQLKNVGIDIGSAPIACSMVAAWMINSSSVGYGLDAQTLKECELIKIPTSKLIGKGTGRNSMTEVPLTELVEYACEDTDATMRLWIKLSEKLEILKLKELFYSMEMPCLQVLLAMERAGVHINSETLGEQAEKTQMRIAEIEQEIFRQAGVQFNVGSPKQLGAILFETLKVHEATGFTGKLAKTTLGYKTDVGVLEQFEEHPFVKLVLEFRELSKLLNTYILVLPQLVKSSTHRIHTQYNQIGTATGRLSSTDPNLQNIPVRTILGKQVRKAFCAKNKDFFIMSADYSQIELRVLAHLANDHTMIQAFASNADIHKETAAKILGKEPSEVTPEERANAKTINFGIIYGMGPQRLAKSQGISVAAAKAFIEKYFLNFSKIKNYLDSQKLMAHDTGEIRTFFGRRRPVVFRPSASPLEVKALENISINTPIQGTAADIMKQGMINVYLALQEHKLKTKLLLQVHDEIVLEGPWSECEKVKELVKLSLENAAQFSVPLVAEIGVGENWLEAK